MPSATFRFHGSLATFRSGQSSIAAMSFERPPSVKDAIESLGVPHPEVDLIVANGAPVDFAWSVPPASEIDVFGIDRPAEFAAIAGLVPPAPDPPRFVLDGHLGRLARYLRTLGFDTWYEPHADDERLAQVSAAEGRILLTRDRGLLKRAIVRLGYLPRSDDPAEQLREVADRYGLAARATPFTRCPRCNGSLVPRDREAVAARLADEPRTLRYFSEFAECPTCGSIYWRGSHYDRMRVALERILET